MTAVKGHEEQAIHGRCRPRPFRCPRCDSSFTLAKNMRTHLTVEDMHYARHGGAEEEEDEEEEDDGPSEGELEALAAVAAAEAAERRSAGAR